MRRMRRLFNTANVLARGRVERTVPFWPIGWIEWMQRYRLRAIIRHAYHTVPFYRQTMEDRGLRPDDFKTIEDLAKLPLIDALTVQRDPEAFLSTHHVDGSRQAFHTSGSSTGIRRVVYWNDASALSRVIYHERDRGVFNDLVGQAKGYRNVHISSGTGASDQVRAFWLARAFLPVGGIQRYHFSPEEPFEVIAEQINAIRPEVVSTYGSYAEHFFRFLADSQMSIALPRVWNYGADTLSSAWREIIENEFGCPVYSAYQAVETGPFGFECERRQGYHLNVDLCAVRLIDEEERTARPGEHGEVVISNLYNRATVLLNYRLGDWGIMASEQCPCGRSLPLLERLEGRTGERLYSTDGRSFSALTLEALCRQALKPALRVQIVQPARGHIRWRIVPSAGTDRNVLRRDLLERCRVVLGEDTKVEVEFVE
jgi:phenylacetate-CoA ligase